MSEIKYKDFYSWYKSKECIDKGKNIDKLWEEYTKQYGCNKKFIHFFKKYLFSDDQKKLLNSIEIVDREGNSILSPSIEKIAKLLYKLRSNFIHNADYIPISSGNNNSILFSEGNKKNKKSYYLKKIDLFTLFPMLEKGVTKYFKSRSKKLK